MSKSLPIAFGLWTPLRRVERKTGRRTATVDEVLELLQSAAAKLRAADVEIRLPNCFAKDAKPRVVIRRKPIDLSESSGLFTAEKLLKFRWEVVLDGEQLDVAKLEEIAQQTRALFRWRGKWVWFDPENYSLEKLAEIAERMRKQPIEELSRVAAIHDLILGYSDWDGIPIETESGDPRLRNWLNQLCRRTSLVDVGVPNGLKFEGDQHFRHYQQSGLNWLSFMNTNGFGALLADDMGLGKTLQTLAWLQHRKNEGHHEPCLLICPTSLMMNWEKESHRFTPGLKLLRHHGNNRAKTDIAIHARSTGRDLVITTYGLLARQVDELAKIRWGAVILDESQNIKNPDTAVSKAARQIARDVPFRLTLTGTPVENRVLDLWTQFDFLNPGLLGTQSEFKRRFLNFSLSKP